MSGKVAVCSVCPKENQQIEAVIKLPKEKRAVIHGTVLDCNGCPVADAVVKLLQVVDGCKLPCPLTHTFTDQYGQFLLHLYDPNINVKLFKYVILYFLLNSFITKLHTLSIHKLVVSIRLVN